jgi:thiamine kinase-like enzyme
MPSERENIKRYLRDLPPATLGVRDTESIEILNMSPGSYNHNFHVRVNQKEFIFRINIEPQSGLSNQIEYEFSILKFLENHRIAPKAYHYDDSMQRFDFGILIEEYLEGSHLTLEKEDVSKVVDLLVKLHSLKPKGIQFVVWSDPLVDTFDLAHNDLIYYESKGTPKKKTINLAKKLLAKSEDAVHKNRHLYDPVSLNHTDVGCDNFIKTTEGLKLIDWEKPRVDDCSYDVCCFLSEPVEMWCSQKILNSEDRVNFLNAYARVSGISADHLMGKVKIREPLVSLHWILWGAIKLCDLRDRYTFPKLLEAHEEKMVRYERIADPNNIEKLLDSWLF